ncbi:MAG: hypothetical protein KIT84_36015 [Labilithrix sp.]|nr:hypothetical protein [Labilithrix sp.]MCW5816460.1 hypothetical protein [Labilithrix sp.]
MLLRVAVVAVVASALGCHAAASSGARRLEGGRSWDAVSDAEVLAVLLPGYDSTTHTAPVTPWSVEDGGEIRQGLSSAPGVRDCAGRVHPAVRPVDEAPSSRTPVAVSTRTVLSKDRLAVWIVTGQDGGFCAPKLGFVALLTRRSNAIAARTTPLRLSCVEVPKRFELIELGSTELLLVEDGSGSEHGGRQLFHVLTPTADGLVGAGSFEGSGQEGLPRDGAVRTIASTYVVSGDELVVTDTWTDESCAPDAASAELYACALTSRGRVEKRLAVRGGKLVARLVPRG